MEIREDPGAASREGGKGNESAALKVCVVDWSCERTCWRVRRWERVSLMEFGLEMETQVVEEQRWRDPQVRIA